MHHLDAEKACFRLFGRGHVWAREIPTCERCERLYQAGDEEGLAAVHARDWDGSAAGVEEGVRNSLSAFRRADLGVVSMADWLPPGVVAAASEGFVPIENLTGLDAAALWPEEHRRAVPETRPGVSEYTADGMCWLVRSPWPSMSAQDAVRLMWEWMQERRPQRSGRVTAEDRAEELALLQEFLHKDEASVLEFRSTHRRPEDQ